MADKKPRKKPANKPDPDEIVSRFCRYCGGTFQVRQAAERCPNCTVEYLHVRNA